MKKNTSDNFSGLNNPTILPIIQLNLLEYTVPSHFFSELQSICSSLLKNKKMHSSRNVETKLAGEIRRGKQLDILPDLSSNLKKYFEAAGASYVAHYKAAKVDLKQYDLIACWLVLQQAGDYNPPHKHGSDLSGVCYIKVPEAISRQAALLKENPKARHTKDGVLEFIANSMLPADADATQGRFVIPHQTKMYLFPSWLIHSVNPFYGKSDRISVAFNLIERKYTS